MHFERLLECLFHINSVFFVCTIVLASQSPHCLCYFLHVKGTFYLAHHYYRLSLLQTLNIPKHLHSIFHKLFPLSNSSLSNMQFSLFHFSHNYWARGCQRVFRGWEMAGIVGLSLQNVELEFNSKLLHRKHWWWWFCRS